MPSELDQILEMCRGREFSAREIDVIKVLQKENESLKAKLKIVTEALEFYADINNWTQRDDYYTSRSFIDESDVKKGWNDEVGFTTKVGGVRARQALEEYKGEG